MFYQCPFKLILVQVAFNDQLLVSNRGLIYEKTQNVALHVESRNEMSQRRVEKRKA